MAPDGAPLPAPVSGKGREPEAYSAPLIEALTMHKTAAIAAELTQQPEIALAAVVHALLLAEFCLDLHLYRSKSCLQIATNQPDLREAAESTAYRSLEEQRQGWFAKLTKAAGDLWKWCLEQDQGTLLELLAFCAGRSFNAVQTKADVAGQDRLAHANALALALHLDMAKWFVPTAGNFFSKVSKARIAEALAEAGKPPSAQTVNLKKADMAAFAEKEIRDTGWLPQPVRISIAGDQEAECSLDGESADRIEQGGAR